MSHDKIKLVNLVPGGKNFMKAMVFYGENSELVYSDIPVPVPGPNQVLIKVLACGVCRTDLHITDKELTEPKLPLIPGHQIVGTIEQAGKNVKHFSSGDLVGVPWLGFTCGECNFCLNEQENLCDKAKFTGYQTDGGFAEYTVADARFCFPVPHGCTALQAAPLLCGGLIGYRAFIMTGNAKRIGFYGFGSAAHILIQLANYQERKIFAFTRDNDIEAQKFALKMGAYWSGNSSDLPPEILDAAIIFAPDGRLVPLALKAVNKGGTVVCAGIHMSDIPSFPYSILWGERKICSVANLTRKNGEEFLSLVPKVPVKTEITVYSLKDANQALNDLRSGKINGSAVITVSD